MLLGKKQKHRLGIGACLPAELGLCHLLGIDWWSEERIMKSFIGQNGKPIKPQLRFRRAVYGGSFDPITQGHINIIRVGMDLFDELIVAVGNNPEKKYTFSLKERLAMVRETIQDFEFNTDDGEPQCEYHNNGKGNEEIILHCHVKSMSFDNRYLAHVASKEEARFLLRGIRNEDDYMYERDMADFNASNEMMCELIRTVWLPCRKDLSGLSSSFVKGLCGPEFWQHVVQPMVPRAAFKMLLKWKGCPNWKPEEDE